MNYNQPVCKSKHDHKQTKSGDTHEFSDHVWSIILDGVGEIIGSGQAKFHPDMIPNVLSMNEITKNTG